MSGIIKKILRLLRNLLLMAILFIVVVTGIFLALFDANAYKQDLADLVRQETGRELEFFGDVSLTMYPALGLKLGALSFSNAPGFGNKPMVKVNEASISVDIASLISLRPEVDQLLLKNLEINLQKNAKGITNWDDLIKPPADASQADSATAAPQPKDTDKKSDFTIRGAFGGLNIQDARLLWKDEQAGVEYLVSDLDIKTGRITPDAPFPLSLHVGLQSKQEIDAKLDLDAGIQYLVAANSVKLSDIKVNLAASGNALPLDNIELDLSTRALSFELAKSLLTLQDLQLNTRANGALLPLGKIRLGLAGTKLSLDLPNNSVKIDGLVIDVDDSRLTGSVTVADYLKPALEFTLASENLDLDAILGTPTVAQKTAQAEVEASKVEPDASGEDDIRISLPVELLRGLQVDGKLAIKKLKIQNLFLHDIDVGIAANAGLIKLDPVDMNLYEGSFAGEVGLDVRAAEPGYRVSQRLENVLIGKLLSDFSGLDKIEGALTASVNLLTSGEWLSELKKRSNGDMDLAFADGAIKGFNLRYLIDKAKAKINKQPEPEQQQIATDFSALSISGKIVNGIFSSSDLNLQAPLIRVGGEGVANLVDNTVDYLVKAKIVKTIGGQQGGALDDLSGLLIPVRIKGPFATPEIDVQLDEMLKDQVAKKLAQEKARLEAKIAKEKAELEQQIADEKARLEAAKAREAEKLEAALEAKKQAAAAKLDREKEAAAAKLAEEQARLKAAAEKEKEDAKAKLLKKLFD